MKRRLKLMALGTLAVLGLITTPAQAQPEPDAAPVAELMEPTLEADTVSATAPIAASEVATDDGQAEPEEGDEAKDELGLAKDAYAAIKAGRWLVLAGTILLLLVSLARRMAGSWGKSRVGGYVMSYAVPIAGALGLSMAAGQWGADVFFGALAAGFAAQGLHGQAKDAGAKLRGG